LQFLAFNRKNYLLDLFLELVLSHFFNHVMEKIMFNVNRKHHHFVIWVHFVML